MKEQKNKYFLYARKSSESEDRQMASIDSQITELQKIAKQYDLDVVDILSESKSAKAPGRKVFTEMVERLNRGEANGILSWKLNRLARNPVDGGTISWMLQQGVIQHIQTFGRSYYPSDNVIVMAVELGLANQYVRDLSTDSRRGLLSKAERGWYPSFAPLGYLNNPLKKKGEKEIIKDPERFGLVRKMFDLILSGVLPQKALTIATEEWGLRTSRGTKFARSGIYRLLSDPFYYGEFEYPKGSGNWFKGNHAPMITREEFDQIRIRLGDKAVSRPKTRDFAFRGPIRCGECGAMITAETKTKKQKNGNVHIYNYYHCTKRKIKTCSQKGVEEKVLEQQISEILSRIEIPEEFYKWAMEVLREQNVRESISREQILKNQRGEYDALLKKIDSLIDMRAGGEIGEVIFKQKMKLLENEKATLEELLRSTEERASEWVEIADKHFKFAENAKKSFEEGDTEIKKSVLVALGSNLTLKDKKLNAVLPQPLILIEECSKEVRELHARLEPLKNGLDYEDLKENYSSSPIMLRRQGSNL